MWVLLFVYMYDTYPYVEKHSTHTDMIKCFYAREALGTELSGISGHFPDGQQAICVKL
jgi:hypothetical protein